MMWYHPLISFGVGLLIGHFIIWPLVRRRRKRKRDELDAWRHQQRIRG